MSALIYPDTLTDSTAGINPSHPTQSFSDLLSGGERGGLCAYLPGCQHLDPHNSSFLYPEKQGLQE